MERESSIWSFAFPLSIFIMMFGISIIVSFYWQDKSETHCSISERNTKEYPAGARCSIRLERRRRNGHSNRII